MRLLVDTLSYRLGWVDAWIISSGSLPTIILDNLVSIRHIPINEYHLELL